MNPERLSTTKKRLNEIIDNVESLLKTWTETIGPNASMRKHLKATRDRLYDCLDFIEKNSGFDA